MNTLLSADERDELLNPSPYAKLFGASSYFIKDNHLFRRYRKGNEELEQHLANFFIIAEAETVRDNGIDQDRVFKMKAVCEGRELASADVPAKDFWSMNFISQTWGMGLRPGIGQNTLAYIRDSISAQADQVKQEHLYTHTGWRKIGGEWVFLHSSGAIGGKDVRVELDGRLSRYELYPAEDIKIALGYTLNFFKLAPKETIYPLIGLTFLTPLNEFMRQAGIEPAFVTYLLGYTGAMKSTLAALTLSFFGTFDNKSLPSSFKDTPNSLEKQGFLLKDVLTVVDDYHPTGSRQEAARMQTTAQSVARMYGDRTGRGRMNADGSLRSSYIPRGNVIVTGEDIPEIGQSGAARNIVIDIEKGSIDKVVLSSLQAHNDQLSSTMYHYIEWVRKQADNLSRDLKAQFIALRKAATADERHSRVAESIAHLQIGMLCFIDYLLDTGTLDQAAADALADDSWKIMLNLAERQNERIQQDKPTLLFISALGEMLSTNQVHVLDIDDKAVHNNGFIGYKDDLYYYLYAESTYKFVVQFYAAQGKNFPVTKNALLKQLATEKLSITDAGRSTKQKKIYGKKQNLLWLNLSAIES